MFKNFHSFRSLPLISDFQYIPAFAWERDNKLIPNLLAEGKAGRRKWQLWHRELFWAASSIPTEVSLGHGYPRSIGHPETSVLQVHQAWHKADQKGGGSRAVSLLQPLQSACGADARPQLPKPKAWCLVRSPTIEVWTWFMFVHQNWKSRAFSQIEFLVLW